jgi:protein subunit release factor B
MESEESTHRRLRINGGLAIPFSEITVRTSRSSGPGGQHANVTASRVEVSFDVLASRSLTDAQRRGCWRALDLAWWRSHRTSDHRRAIASWL